MIVVTFQSPLLKLSGSENLQNLCRIAFLKWYFLRGLSQFFRPHNDFLHSPQQISLFSHLLYKQKNYSLITGKMLVSLRFLKIILFLEFLNRITEFP